MPRLWRCGVSLLTLRQPLLILRRMIFNSPTPFASECVATDCQSCRLSSGAGGVACLLSKELEAPMLQGSSETYAANTLIVRAGVTPARLYALKQGWAYRYLQLDNGKRQILDFLIPGDLFDLDTLILGGGGALVSTRSLTPTRTCSIPAPPDMPHTRAEAALQGQLHEMLRRHLLSKASLLADLGRRSATPRLARFILRLHARLHARGMAQDGVFDFPLRQDHLADALGLTSVHVSRICVSLREAKVMSIYGRRLAIWSMQGLTDFASE